MKRDMKKRILVMIAAVMMTVVNVSAQRLQVVDSDGQGIPLASVLTEDGILIATTDLNGVVDDVKGAARVTVTHVAFKPQQVTIASLTNGRVTMEDIDYDLAEIVVTPKQYIYVEDFYRVYVYRNDSLCYFLSGIMPNAYDLQKKKLEHGSYNQARCEYSPKMGVAVTWSVRAQGLGAGKVRAENWAEKEKKMKDTYFVTVSDESPKHKSYRNQQGLVGQLIRSDGQTRITLDAGKMQMYANEAKGQKKLLERRQEKDYEYQFTLIYADNEDENCDVTSYVIATDQWEYNDKKSHVKFIIENYATDHYYISKEEWKARKKAIKEDYGSMMTLSEIASYEQRHNIPALSPATRQAIGKMKQW